VNIKTEQVISVGDWDKLITSTYGKMYSFQQQEDCQPRGRVCITIPDAAEEYDYTNTTLPEVVNHSDMGVSFAAWLARDPKQPLDGNGNPEKASAEQWKIDLWWARNFYPAIQMVGNDLHSKGLIEAGEYTIDIDW
jgi:hypothetical protein